MTKGAGRLRASVWALYEEPTELILLMLDVDNDFECPRTGPPALPPVEALARFPACLTRSVRICRGNRDPEAAKESMGIFSLT